MALLQAVANIAHEDCDVEAYSLTMLAIEPDGLTTSNVDPSTRSEWDELFPSGGLDENGALLVSVAFLNRIGSWTDCPSITEEGLQRANFIEICHTLSSPIEGNGGNRPLDFAPEQMATYRASAAGIARFYRDMEFGLIVAIDSHVRARWPRPRENSIRSAVLAMPLEFSDVLVNCREGYALFCAALDRYSWERREVEAAVLALGAKPVAFGPRNDETIDLWISEWQDPSRYLPVSAIEEKVRRVTVKLGLSPAASSALVALLPYKEAQGGNSERA